MKQEGKYQKGHFLAMGMAIGIPCGVPLGMALGNMAVGPAIGLALGLIIGWVLEERYNKNGITLSAEEQMRQKKSSLLFFGIGSLILLSLIAVYQYYR